MLLSEASASSNPFTLRPEAEEWWFLSLDDACDGPVAYAIDRAAYIVATMELHLAHGYTLGEAWRLAQCADLREPIYDFMMGELIECWAFDIVVQAWAKGRDLENLVNSRWKMRRAVAHTEHTSATMAH